MNTECTIEIITPENHREASFSQSNIADFLHEHLDRFRDPRNQIIKCLDYALGKVESRRGSVLVAKQKNNRIAGAAVLLETGMSEYVPENLLVYIAVDAKTRGRGIGKLLMEKAVEMAGGDVALHVEPDNPARRLYERIGFTSKYLEMRFKK